MKMLEQREKAALLIRITMQNLQREVEALGFTFSAVVGTSAVHQGSPLTTLQSIHTKAAPELLTQAIRRLAAEEEERQRQ